MLWENEQWSKNWITERAYQCLQQYETSKHNFDFIIYSLVPPLIKFVCVLTIVWIFFLTFQTSFSFQNNIKNIKYLPIDFFQYFFLLSLSVSNVDYYYSYFNSTGCSFDKKWKILWIFWALFWAIFLGRNFTNFLHLFLQTL